jgi:hypothetical protein
MFLAALALTKSFIESECRTKLPIKFYWSFSAESIFRFWIPDESIRG